MKLLMESWRRYLNESGFGEGTPPDGEFYKKQVKYLEEDNEVGGKVIFMAGAPGAGKSTVIKKLGLENMEIINPDEFYEPALEKSGLGKNIKKIKEDFLSARDELKEVLSDILRLEEPEDGWAHDVLMGMFEDALKSVGDLRSAVYNLETIKGKYDNEREKIVMQAKLFAQAQKDAKEKQALSTQEGKSFIIDGTGGFYSRIINQKKDLEEQGYETAMIFVDIPLQVALDRQSDRLARGGRGLDSKAVSKSWKTLHGSEEEPAKHPGLLSPFVDRHGRDQLGYAKEFGPNFFHIVATDEEMDESVAEAKPRLDAFLNQMNEDSAFQDGVEQRLPDQMKRLLRHGGNQDSGPFDEEAPIDYRGSAPPGAPGG